LVSLIAGYFSHGNENFVGEGALSLPIALEGEIFFFDEAAKKILGSNAKKNPSP